MSAPKSFYYFLLFLLLDLILIALLYVPTIAFHNIKPYQRGFYCNDESISHPYKESTVSGTIMILLTVLLPIITIIIVEVTHYFFFKTYHNNNLNNNNNLQINARNLHCFQLHAILDNIFIACAHFFAGYFIVLTFTNLGKVIIGRLRPHFFDVCKPNWGEIVCTEIQNGFKRYLYVENVTCTASDGVADIGDYKLNDARKSFPSGHASLSLFSAMFIVLYTQYRVHWKNLYFLKMFIHTMILLLAMACALSRISDYKHHWSDVLVGSLLGILVAFIQIISAWKLNKKYSKVEKSQLSIKEVNNSNRTDLTLTH